MMTSRVVLSGRDANRMTVLDISTLNAARLPKFMDVGPIANARASRRNTMSVSMNIPPIARPLREYDSTGFDFRTAVAI